MADKDFGAKRINLIGATGTPTITSPTDLIIKANNVAISTNTTIGGRLGIGITNPTTTVSIAGTLSFPNNNIKIGDNTTGCSITSGTDNFFAGKSAGALNASGFSNNFFGSFAGITNTTGCHNNFLGQGAGSINSSGCFNNFFGCGAGGSGSGGNNTGSHNNFLGNLAGSRNGTGCYNNFFGNGAGIVNSGGSCNNFFGRGAGSSNTSGSNNNFLGNLSGSYNTIGSNNNFLGPLAGRFSTTGCNNNFLGNSAGKYNTNGAYNNFFGQCSGYSNNAGSRNNFFGTSAGVANTSGNFNNFIGDQAGFCNTNGSYNNFIGANAGLCNTIGFSNNFIGFNAGCSNTSGVFNTFIGNYTGKCNTSGNCNNFIGAFAGRDNTIGSFNNFFGLCVGTSNIDGCCNNFIGYHAGRFNTSGSNNNFIGSYAGRTNISGGCNNFLGASAGRFNTAGCNNNFFGVSAGRYNSNGCCNNFFGANAGRYNSNGCSNNFFGAYAGLCNSNGSFNSFFGNCAGGRNINGCYNAFFGTRSGLGHTSGSYNTFFGVSAAYTQTSGNRNVAIGYSVQLPNTTGSDQLAIGLGNTSWITGNSSFNIGIGTTNPTSKLHVVGNTLITGITTVGFISASNAYVSGISTFTNGPVLIGGGTSTGSAGQVLQISGINSSVYIGGSIGIGTTNPTSKLWVGGDGYFTGVVTATTFNGNLTGIASTATNLGAGNTGSLPYQNAPGSTIFLSGGNNGQVLVYDTGLKAPKWGDVGEASGAFAGIDVRDEDSTTISGIKTLNFRGDNITAVSDSVSGISTIIANSNIVGTSLSISGITTLSSTVNISGSVGIGTTNPTSKLWVNGDGYFVGVVTSAGFYVNGELIGQGGISGTNLVGTALSVSGISTLGTVKISSGIVTATTGVVTFYGNFVGTATSAGYATTAFSLNGSIESNLNVAYAQTAGIATYATRAGVSTDVIGGIASVTSLYVDVTGISTLGTVKISSGIVTATTGVVTFYGNFVGTATSAGYATTAFSLNGSIESNLNVAYAQTAGIASSVALNSVGLGTNTYGDYVKSITGTANEITVTGGTGEGSTPTLSIPNQFTVPQDLTVIRDVQIDRNLNVNGNITIGGTSAYILVDTFRVSDADIILGFRTDGFENDVSNDTTANHGGIAVASTEGSPLVNLTIAGIETVPSTYKKIMWFKAGSFAGLGTDAWLFNYAVGIGSTQFPAGTRLAAGSVQFTENDLEVVRNINSTGIITANKFVGALDATSAQAQSVGFATTATNLANGAQGSLPYQSSSGITSFVSVGTNNQVLLYDTGANKPYWGNVSSGEGSFAGITVRDEGTTSLSNIVTVDIFGSNITATSSGAGIASIRVNDNLVGTALSISGISTLGTVQISSGIVTATSGVVTYYGDGSKLTGLTAGVSISTNTTNQEQYLTYVTETGTTTGFGITTTGLVFNPFTGNFGIGTSLPTTRISIAGTTGISFADNNIRIGDVSTGSSITTGSYNFFGGSGAGKFTTGGSCNNFLGRCAGYSNSGGSNNNFLGSNAGRCNTSGDCNNFFGRFAGYQNTTGFSNNFFGSCVGYSNTTGCHNNFFGASVGKFNTSGCYNNFLGSLAGYQNTIGCHNNFLGSSAGRCNTSGICNNFLGSYAGFYNTIGSYNNFFGSNSGYTNTTGTNNNFFGYEAGYFNNGTNNNFIGRYTGRMATGGYNNNFFGCRSGYYNNGNDNNFLGYNTGSDSTGSNNNFFGVQAGRYTTGSSNNFLGSGAGYYNTTGSYNNFFGYEAGYANTTGSSGNYNNFFGYRVGYANSTGCYNNFLGVSAGQSNISGCHNNFLGYNAGYTNTYGGCNNFFGFSAGRFNTSGGCNNFFGVYAGRCNTTGSSNNFFGRDAGRFNTTGTDNNFLGRYAGYRITTGTNNNFFGNRAGCANITGSQNVVIGYNQQTPITSGDNQLVIGAGNTAWINGNSSYNVGVGTTNPDKKLHVQGDIKITGGIYDINNSSGNSNRVLTANGSGGWSWQPVTSIGAISGVAINNDFSTDASRYLLFTDSTSGTVSTEYVSATQLVFNPSSGNLGIGTTVPTEKLQVNGNISINGTTSYGSVTATTATVSQTAIHSGLSTSTYRSVEYTIQATQGTNFHATKILSIHNGTVAYNSEYGIIYNNGSVGTFDVDVSGGNIRLLVTPASSSSTTYTINFVATKI